MDFVTSTEISMHDLDDQVLVDSSTNPEPRDATEVEVNPNSTSIDQLVNLDSEIPRQTESNLGLETAANGSANADTPPTITSAATSPNLSDEFTNNESATTGTSTLENQPSNQDQDHVDQDQDQNHHHQSQLQNQSHSSNQNPQLSYGLLSTGYVYDPRMRLHMEISTSYYGDESQDLHPEDPRRIWQIHRKLADHGLIQGVAPYGIKDPSIPNIQYQPLVKILGPDNGATSEQICLVHSPAYYQWVMNLQHWDQTRLLVTGKQLDSVYLHNLTPLAALLSAGGAIAASKAVLTSQIRNAIAIIRPPGHHAEHKAPGGFCFFNNVCVAARVCQKEHPDLCKKVLILDWDVHHGNGIQDIFESDPSVLYISLHVHKGGNFYPLGPKGGHDFVGKDKGIGKNINIPWPQHYMGDADYIHAFQQIVMPCAQEFDPDLVLIAAGFDAAVGDALGQCLVTPAGFAQMTHMLKSLANGKVIACLEGGYNLEAIAESALAVTKVLNGEPPQFIGNLEPCPAAIDTVKMVISEHSKYWECLYPKESPGLRLNINPAGGTRIDLAIREYQSDRYWREYRFIRMYVYEKNPIPSSTYNQSVWLLGSETYESGNPIIVIFHEGPHAYFLEAKNTIDLDLQNIVMTDYVAPIIKRARSADFTILDVYIPPPLNDQEGDNNEARNFGNELASYIYQNYVEDAPFETDVFFVGIGSATSAMIHVLNSFEQSSNIVKFVFSFIKKDQPLHGVVRPADDYFPGWYFNHSMIFVSDDHSTWAPDRVRKQRKKFGYLVKSNKRIFHDMIFEHIDTVFEKVVDELSFNWEPSSANAKNETESHNLESLENDDANSNTHTNTNTTISNNTDLESNAMAIDVSRPDQSELDAVESAVAVKDMLHPHSPTNGIASPSSPGNPNLNSSPTRMPPIGTFSVTTPERGS